MELSLCITTFNRFALTIKSCAQVLDDNIINDIIVLDDASTDGSYEKLVEHFSPYPHVRVIRQAVNRNMSINKRDTVSYAKNDWVILLDSDNIIDKSYTKAFYQNRYEASWELGNDDIPDLSDTIQHPASVIYCPTWARPSFDFRDLHKVMMSDGIEEINMANVGAILQGKYGDNLNMLLNCCNYICNKNRYLEVYEHNPEHRASDTVWMSYLWLKSGGSFQIVPNMEYDHLVHKGSAFLEDANYNMRKANEVLELILAL